MDEKTFYILDVFAEEKYQGNQLAVFTQGSHFTSDQMQQIAKEINYSETTFICSNQEEKNGGYDVRIFTPNEEVPFAGHPTLGTAYIIQQKMMDEKKEKVKLNVKAGQIPVECKNDLQGEILWMKQNQPDFGDVYDVNEIAAILNITKEEIDTRFPIQDVSTGLPFIIVPLTSLDVVKKASIDQSKLYRFIKNTRAKALLIFSTETYEKTSDLNARVFCHYYGVPEDPATGSANGTLAGYLIKHRYFGRKEISITVEQGYEINRPSKLYLKAEEIEGNIHIYVGGKVVEVAKGEWL